MNKYELKITTQFKKDLKRVKKRNFNISLLNEVVETLLRGEVLQSKYLDHALTGNYKGFRECHINPDWLLIYYIDDNQLILTTSRTGSHSDLF